MAEVVPSSRLVQIDFRFKFFNFQMIDQRKIHRSKVWTKFKITILYVIVSVILHIKDFKKERPVIIDGSICKNNFLDLLHL